MGAEPIASLDLNVQDCGFLSQLLLVHELGGDALRCSPLLLPFVQGGDGTNNNLLSLFGTKAFDISRVQCACIGRSFQEGPGCVAPFCGHGAIGLYTTL